MFLRVTLKQRLLCFRSAVALVLTIYTKAISALECVNCSPASNVAVFPSCRISKDWNRCVPTFVQSLTGAEILPQTYAARNFARITALELFCSLHMVPEACEVPCAWKENLGCLPDQHVKRQPLVCKGSQVEKHVQCHLIAPVRSEEANLTCSASALCTYDQIGCVPRFLFNVTASNKTAYLRSWVSVNQDSWGCCEGSVLWRMLNLGCQKYKDQECLLDSNCKLYAGGCHWRSAVLARMLFGTTGMGRTMQTLARTCEGLSEHKCEQYKPVQVRVSALRQLINLNLPNTNLPPESCIWDSEDQPETEVDE